MEESGSGYSSPAARALNANGKRVSTGVIFFKTKLCSKFRAGTCPYITNCNFAHGMEELRKPPPGWEEFVNPPPPVSPVDAATPNKSRLCKNFFTEGVCPFGERCIFSHDDPRAKPAPALVTPGSVSPAQSVQSAAGGAKPSNWKTRLCNKWETTGYCPFAEKCHFAHGVAELQRYLEPSQAPDTKSPLSTKETVDSVVPPPPPPSQQQQQHVSSKPTVVWGAPTEGISTVYGDWVEEDEYDE